MSLAVRPASLPEDEEELIAVLERNLPGAQMRAHFRWRHEANPAGPAWSWVIYNSRDGAIRAMTSLFPRRMYWDRKLVTCGQVGEFVVDGGYRSLGPAVMLQRATFQPVDSGALTFCYDCPPHDQGMSTFVRLGMRPSCELTRYAIPLRSDEVLRKRLGKRAWTRPVIAGANLVLSMRRARYLRAGLEIGAFEEGFGDEFNDLDSSVPSAGVVRSSRSAELLNWRYRHRSDLDIQVLVARRAGELLAFLAFIIYPENRASVLDLFGRELNAAGLPLLGAAVELCRQRKVFCLEGYCTEASELKPLFEAAGFRAREKAASVVAYAQSGEISGSNWSSSVSWPLGHAELNA